MDGKLSLAGIFRAHAAEFLAACASRLPSYVAFALWSIIRCRTAALGGRVLRCAACGHEQWRYNSCRHRACPQCEGDKDAAWCQARQSELLPTHYFHLVFTVSHTLNNLFLANKRVCFSLLFQAAAKTVQKVGRQRLKGARLGFFAILHTWGQLLNFHPHIHLVIPGGGVSADGKWIMSSRKKRYFASTKVLALVFRAILIKSLKRAYRERKIVFDGDFEALINSALQKPWLVHAQPPFASPSQLLKYLSRYTRKVAFSNSRLVSYDKELISFSFKDYANAAKKKLCHMHVLEFMRRFLLHVPPPRFVRIRHFGFMAGKGRNPTIEKLKSLIAGLLPVVAKAVAKSMQIAVGCPLCGASTLLLVATLLPRRLNSS